MRRLHESLVPAIWLCRTAGLAPYRLEGGRVLLSRAAAAWSCACVLAQLVVVVIIPYYFSKVKRMSKTLHNATGAEPIWQFPYYAVNIVAAELGSFCVLGSLILDLAKNRKHYATILKHLSFADKALSSDSSVMYREDDRFLKVKTVIAAFVILVLYSSYMVTLEGWNHMRGIAMVVQTLPISLNIFWVMTIVLSVRKRLSAINRHLQLFRVKYFDPTMRSVSIKELCNPNSRLAAQTKASVPTVTTDHYGPDMIHVLRAAYNSICIVMGSLVQSHQLFVAIELMCLFSCANVNVFGFMGGDPNWRPRLCMFILNIIHLLCLVVPGHFVAVEVDFSLEQVYQLLSVQPVEGRLVQELRQLAWQLRLRKPQLRLAGIFTVDLRLLVGFITTLVTYVVLLYTFSN